MTESVGMQLDDDSLLALFSRVCCAVLKFCLTCPTRRRHVLPPEPLTHHCMPHNAFLGVAVREAPPTQPTAMHDCALTKL